MKTQEIAESKEYSTFLQAGHARSLSPLTKNPPKSYPWRQNDSQLLLFFFTFCFLFFPGAGAEISDE